AGGGASAGVAAGRCAPRGPIDVGAVGADVLICSPYKFYGPHLGLAFGKAELLERWLPYKVRPASDQPLGHRFETGTLPHELLAGFVAAVQYVDSIGWEGVQAHEHELGDRFLNGLPDTCTADGLSSMDGRGSTFAVNLEGQSPRAVAGHLGARTLALWAA